MCQEVEPLLNEWRMSDGEIQERFAVTSSAGVEVLEAAMGSYGRWHLFLTISLSLINLPSAWFKLIVVFLSPPVKFWCIDPAPNANLTGELPTCSVPDADGKQTPCTAWEYDRSTFRETIVTEWDLVCDRAQLANVAQMLFMGGFLIGCLLGGVLADRLGRKPVLVWSCIIQLIAGLLTAIAPWFTTFLILRFITAMADAATTVTGFVILMEVTGKRWRTDVNIMAALPFSIGHCLLAYLAYLTRHWRYLQLAISIPAVLLLSYIWTVPESPRWLLSAGQPERAEEIVRYVAKVNRTGAENWKAPTTPAQEKKEKDSKIPLGGLGVLFSSPALRKCTLITFANWLSAGLVFYGLAQYMGQIGGNIFMNVFLSGLLEPPGMAIACIMLRRCGRRTTLMTGQFATALTSLCVLLVPSDSSIWTSLLSGIGLCAQTVAFPVCYVFAAELFPTVIRNAAVGASSTVARVGSMIAPFVATLSVINKALPPVVFGAVPLFAGLLVYFLPETLGKDLPETIEQAERQARRTCEKKPIRRNSVNGQNNVGYVEDGV